MISLKSNVEGGLTTWFEDVYLIHNAISEVTFDDINLEVSFLGHKLKAPLLIAGMTGGHDFSLKINSALAEAAEKLGIAIGVGSQRAAIENPKLRYTYSIVREKAPTAFVIANIGAAQVARYLKYEDLQEVISMIDANALAVHLNLLHEILQPEGQPNFKGLLTRLQEIKSLLKVPLIIKETGSGISKEVAHTLSNVVDAIDVGGAGGTNWALVEYERAKRQEKYSLMRLSKLLLAWGIPTAISICEVRATLPNMPLIATGGIRTGLDIAKAIALGADLVGIALPLLRAAYSEGKEGVIKTLEQMIFELKAIMVLVGASTIEELKRVPIMFSHRFIEWLKYRELEEFIRRRCSNLTTI